MNVSDKEIEEAAEHCYQLRDSGFGDSCHADFISGAKWMLNQLEIAPTDPNKRPDGWGSPFDYLYSIMDTILKDCRDIHPMEVTDRLIDRLNFYEMELSHKDGIPPFNRTKKKGYCP